MLLAHHATQTLHARMGFPLEVLRRDRIQEKTPSVFAEGSHQGASTSSESSLTLTASGQIKDNDGNHVRSS